MKTKLCVPHLTILAALGLELACVGRVGTGQDGADADGSGDASTGDGDASTGESTSESTSGSTSASTSGSTSESGDGDTGTETGPPPDPYTCDNPTPILQEGTQEPSGFVLCEGGFIHRETPVTCVAPTGPDSPTCAEFGGGCMTGADCVAQPHGSCIEEALSGCYCHYGCETDDDCSAGEICACAGVFGPRAACIPAGCVSDDDCADDGGLCGLSRYEDCCGDVYSMACAGPEDECHSDAECGEELCDPLWPEGGTVMYHCTAAGAPGFGCEPPGWCNCDCGRPFFVAGEARTAPICERGDWLEPCAVDLAKLDGPTRAELAADWLEIAAFEQASVASFARFALQLMRLGAPPRLLLDTQRALAEEIEHARLAFGLASAYAGVARGPGALDVSASLDDAACTAASIVEGLIVEACVGETLAALEAREAAAVARDPEVRAVLEAIAEDELRHAQLGWRTLRWILDRLDPAGVARALAILDAAMLAVRREPEVADERERRARREHGILDGELRREVRRAGLDEVIAPCVQALHVHLQADARPARAQA